MTFSATFDPRHYPLQHAHIFAVAGPQECAIGIFTKPVDHEDARWVGDPELHHKPMVPVITDVVTNEGKHRHGIASHDAHLARSRRGGFRTHCSADKDPM